MGLPSASPADLTALAVDWSGALRGERRKIWLAEARAGRLVRLECGRSREELIAHAIDFARNGPDVVLGIDFAFSLPAWFLRERGLPTAPDLWRLAAVDGERWLRGALPVFWGRSRMPRPRLDPSRPPFRRTESEVPARGSLRPKSVFQIGGAGAVGTGSLRGMPHLLALREAGFSVWPFDPPRFPLALEIYPRYLTGPLNKSDRAARALALRRRRPAIPERLLERASSNDDAFDAALSALVLSSHARHLRSLPAAADDLDRLEGRIWRPAVDPCWPA